MRKYLEPFSLALAAGLTFAAAPLAAQELTGTLKKVKDTGSITIGHRDASIPFSYYDDKQQPVGFAMDICARVVDAIKTELKLPKIDVKYQLVTSANRIPLMANGTVDLECGSTTNNVERQKQVSFTNSALRHGEPIRDQEGQQDRQIDDLKGKTVVSTSGTTNIKQLNDVNNETQARHQHPSGQRPRRGVPDGRDRPGRRLRDGRHPAGQPGRQLQDAGRLHDLLGRLLAAGALRDHAAARGPRLQACGRCRHRQLYKSGEIDKIYAKWFQSPIPPERPQPQHADEPGAEEGLPEPDRQRRSDQVLNLNEGAVALLRDAAGS